MPGFDVKAYEDGVLKPLRSRMPNLPDDLRSRYAVEPKMDPATLRDRVDAVVSVWNKHAMRSGPMGQVCKLLQREHKELEAKGEDPRSPQFWTQWAAERQRRVGGQINQVVTLLAGSFGPLGVITAQQLEAMAANHSGLGNADLAQACTKAKLRVVEPVDLPTSSGMRGSFSSLVKELATAGAPSVPALLHPGIMGFGLLGGFTAPRGGSRVTLDRKAAEDRNTQLEMLPDDPAVRAQKVALGLLVSEAGYGGDLAAIALYHLLTEVRARRTQGAQPIVLHALLVDRGLVPDEAALVAVSVFAEGGAPPRDPMAEVADLLAEGRLVAAQQAAVALPAPDGDAAREAVARQRQRVDDLREKAQEAQRAGHEEQAGAHLREALRLGADVPGLAEELASLPAPPVLGVTASPDGVGVRVAWRPSAGHGDDTEYRVVRGVGRDPADPEDGTAVPVASGHAAADAGPPVGRDVHYTVFARSPGGRWSRPTSATTRVVPPVADVHVDGEHGAVVGRWRTHPDVVSVEVTRHEGAPDAPGVPIAAARGRDFRDTTSQEGVQYFYKIVACYPTAGGGVLRAQAEMRRGATRVQAHPVKSLTATVTTGDGLSVRLAWRQQPGNEVVVRRASSPCPWEYKAAVPMAELQRWGTELDGRLTVNNGSATLVAAVPPGRSYYVAFTLDVASALRGQDAVVDLTDPVRQVRAQRFGDDVLVTWQWPEAVTAADVRWDTGARRITKQRFLDDGGFRLVGARTVRRVDIAAVVFDGGGDETTAPAVSVEVEERPPQLTYALQRRGHRFAGGVRCVVTVTAAESAADGTLVLVGASGHTMPLTPQAGVEILRQPISVTPSAPLVLPEVTVPAHLRKPYWLRCFLVEGGSALLVDPPVSQLKVS